MPRRRAVLACAPSLLLAGRIGAAQAQPRTATALVPAADAAVLQRLHTLAPNQALNLGRARVVGDFNEVARRFELHVTGPRARDFSLKMCWAPERRRALFLGANHAVPHRLNDVWEFDLAAMAWMLLYAPDHPRSYAGLGEDASDAVFRDGVLRTRRGGPAVIGHSWSGLSYDAARRHLLFMNVWPIDQAPLVQQLGGDPGARYAGPPLWAFTPASRTWQPLKADAQAPRAPMGALLEFVPELGGAVWHMNNWEMQATWLHDSDSGRWRVLAGGERASKAFVANAPGREAVGYHDPGRRLLIVQKGLDTFHFDTTACEWSKVAAGQEGQAPYGHDAQGSIHFAAGSGQGLLVDFKRNELWAYDPDARRWWRQVPAGASMPLGKRRLAFVDQHLKVLAVIDDTEVWSWRYR